jgi:hypothetical protein
MFGLLLYLADYHIDVLLLDSLPLATIKPIFKIIFNALLTNLCKCYLISSKVEPLLDYSFPVVVLLGIVFFEKINLF